MKRTERGVSLIEMMIGIVIMGILIAMAAPSFQDWIMNSRVRTAAESVKNGLQLARSDGVRRNLPVRWRLDNTSGGDWSVFERDTPANTIQTRTSNEGTTSAVVTSSQATIDFNGTGQVTPTPAAPIIIDVTNSTGTCQSAGGEVRCLRILVSNGGQIRMCDPALAAGVAGAC